MGDAEKRQRSKPSSVRTPALKDSEPHWNETHPLNSWRSGDALEFKVHDSGSQVEAHAILESNEFVLDGYEGDLRLEGRSTHGGASLHVRVCRGRMVQSSAWAGSVPPPSF